MNVGSPLHIRKAHFIFNFKVVKNIEREVIPSKLGSELSMCFGIIGELILIKFIK